MINDERLPNGRSGTKTLVKNHPVYWFEDGSLILDVEIHRFRVHRTLLSRHSRFFSNLAESSKVDNSKVILNAPSPVHDRHVVLEPTRLVKAEDVEALLQHLYHDVPFGAGSPWNRVASIFRVTSPQQLDFPQIHESAREIFHALFPIDPSAFTHTHPLHEALPLATEFKLTSVRKAILYSLVTTTDFDVSDTAGSSTLDPQTHATTDLLQTAHKDSGPERSIIPAPVSGETLPIVGESSNPKAVDRDADEGEPRQSPVLSPEDAKLCMTLMTRLIEHFTPTLFTPPPTTHMECTDALADKWMSMVIQPAIEDGGVYKPLETLQRLKGLEWEKHGLCPSCAEHKRREWTEEQREVWRMMDVWLSENHATVVA